MKQYINYLKKTFSWLNQLSKDENLSLAWLYWDYAWAVIRHRCLIRQYVIGEFWKFSNPERKKCLTYNRIVKLFNLYNIPTCIFKISMVSYRHKEEHLKTKCSQGPIT